MNNPIVVPMSVASNETSAPMRVGASADAIHFRLGTAITVSPVTGVKGNAEAEYRHGDVNLTPADLGIDLTGYVVDPSYVHTDNNFTNALKTKLDDLFTIGITINGNTYDVSYFVKGEWNGVPGLGLCYNDGSLDGGFIFIVDGDTLSAFDDYIQNTYATIASLPTKTSDLNNDSGFITSADVPTKTSELQNDSHFVADANYVHTDNNFTSTAKAKLGTIEGYAQKNIIEEVQVNGTALTVTNKAVDVTVPTNTSDLNNDSGYLTSSDAVTSFNGAVGAVTYSAHEVPSGGNAGQVLKKISGTDYDYGWKNESEILPSAYCTTSGSTAAKKASCSLWAATSNSYLHFLLGSANTSASALTLEINVTGAKPVYINGEASSATNYSLPAGSYIIFYDGTNYHFRTDGKLPADITGLSAKTASIPMGTVDGTSTSTVFTATIDGITELRNGVCCYLTNGVVTSATGWTLNINGLGAKPVYQTQAAASRATSIFNVAYTGLFVYNESRVEGGCWDYFYGYNSDTNTTAYQVRHYQSNMLMMKKLYRYEFLLTDRATGKLIPTNNTSNKPTTYTKALNTDPFDPKRGIYYYSTTSTIEADASPGASYIWNAYPTCDMRYGFNINTGGASALTAKQPVYLRCVPQTDRTLVLDGNDCVTQTLPTTADGLVYLYLGMAYSTYQIELSMEHPCYIYDSNISAVTSWG